LPALYLKYRQQTPLVFDWADWLGRGGSVEERANPLLRALLRPLETGFEEQFRRQAVGNTVICTTLQQKALALGVSADTVLLLPNGADTARFQPVDQLGARQRVGLAADAVYIGYCGTIFQRDAILMAQAFDRLHQQYPTTRLLVIGYCPVDLRTLVQTPAAVIQTGFVDDAQINDYLNACDICWLPLCDTNANRGRWPLKLSDYMAVGRPIVATAVGDVIPLFEQEAIGLLALDQPEPFAAQTAKLVVDADLRVRLGQRAREVALTRYDWGKLTEQLLEFYSKNVPVGDIVGLAKR
jgi:glycosyltransferase involved in cell wall biosynthesis